MLKLQWQINQATRTKMQFMTRPLHSLRKAQTLITSNIDVRPSFMMLTQTSGALENCRKCIPNPKNTLCYRSYTSTKPRKPTGLHVDNNDQITSLFDEIVKNMVSVDFSHRKAHEFIDILLSAKVKDRDIVKLLCDKPEILKHNPKAFSQQVSFLRGCGFHPEDLIQMINTYPEIIVTSQNVIKDCFEYLRGMGFTEGTLQSMIIKNPLLLNLNTRSVSEHFAKLMTVFRKSDSKKLIEDQPNLLTDSWESIEERVHYVSMVMGLDQQHMINSGAFYYSLDHIRSRHSLLLRAGLYEKPNKHGITKTENPTLKEILRSSDKTFAAKIANMSLGEVEAFTQILKMEIEFDQNKEQERLERSMSDDKQEGDSEFKDEDFLEI